MAKEMATEMRRVAHTAFCRGFVRVEGLCGRVDLNGCEVQVSGDLQNGRYPVAVRRGVHVDSTRVLIKLENLRPLRSADENPEYPSGNRKPTAHKAMVEAPPLWDEGLLPDGQDASTASTELGGQRLKFFFDVCSAAHCNMDAEREVIGCPEGASCTSPKCPKIGIEIPFIAYGILCCDVVLLRAFFRMGAGGPSHVATPVMVPEVYFGGSRPGLRDPSLRFRIGDHVACCTGRPDRHAVWRPGRIVKLWYREDVRARNHPYQILLTDGGTGDLIYAPTDTDVRAAAHLLLRKPHYSPDEHP